MKNLKFLYFGKVLSPYLFYSIKYCSPPHYITGHNHRHWLTARTIFKSIRGKTWINFPKHEVEMISTTTRISRLTIFFLLLLTRTPIYSSDTANTANETTRLLANAPEVTLNWINMQHKRPYRIESYWFKKLSSSDNNGLSLVPVIISPNVIQNIIPSSQVNLSKYYYK